MLKLVHTTDKTTDMMLLVEESVVIGAWDYVETVFAQATAESIQDWVASYPEQESIEDYGEVVQTK